MTSDRTNRTTLDFVHELLWNMGLITLGSAICSVAINGISLTIASVADREFSVAFIPTTLARTTVADWKIGDEVNVESDVLVRTIIHALRGMIGNEGLTEAKLREHGFL